MEAKVTEQVAGIEARLRKYEENVERMKRIQQLENLVQQWKDMHTLLNTTGHTRRTLNMGRGTYSVHAQPSACGVGAFANEHLSAMQIDYLLEVRSDGTEDRYRISK